MQFQNILPRTNLSKTFLKMVAPTFTTIGPQTSLKGTYRWLLIRLEEMLHDGSNTEINEMILYCVLAISESRVRQRWVKTNKNNHLLPPPSHPFVGGGAQPERYKRNARWQSQLEIVKCRFQQLHSKLRTNVVTKPQTEKQAEKEHSVTASFQTSISCAFFSHVRFALFYVDVLAIFAGDRMANSLHTLYTTHTSVHNGVCAHVQRVNNIHLSCFI